MKIKCNSFTKSIFIFWLTFLVLAFIFNFNYSKNICNNFITVILPPIINTINPHIHVSFEVGAPKNDQGWNMSFLIYDARKVGKKKAKKFCRNNKVPNAMLFQNLHHLVLIPSIIIFCLSLISPINLKERISILFFNIIIFSIFLSFYLSYRFEFTLNNNSLEIDSFWHLLLSILGLGGTSDGIYVIVILIWSTTLLLMKPQLISDFIK